MRHLIGPVIIATLLATDASAQVVVDPPSHPRSPDARIDTKFHAIRDVLESYGPSSGFFGPDGLGDVRLDGTAALLRFDRVLNEAELADVRAAGVELFTNPRGGVLRVGTVYGAFVPWTSLDALATTPALVWAEPAWHPKIEQPLEVTGTQIGAASAVRLPIVGTDGAGRLIADIDSGVDVLHPHLFHADGGAFAWIDVDGDGELTPGVDAVDYDGDGAAGSNEMLRVLDGAWLDHRGDVVNQDRALDTRYDWLYADRNGDRERNVGSAAGFTEFDPGYGEPAFVADDANRNQRVDPTEKLVLLGSSKIRRFVTPEATWTRGENLIEAASWSGLEDSFHGTGVASILVGGQPRGHERLGIAPGADLLMYTSYDPNAQSGFEDTVQLRAIEDALASGADVVVHEWTNPYTAPHDGSGNLEAAMDSARAGGLVQVCPLGNMNRSEKHRELDVSAGQNVEFRFVVDNGFRWGAQTYPYTVAYLSLFWRGDQQPPITLVNPDGEERTLSYSSQDTFRIGSEAAVTWFSRSGRGTNHLVLSVWNEAQNSILQGTWGLRFTSEQPDRFIGRVADYYSSWNIGIHWEDPTSDFGTMVYPSTADSAVGVAAYAGRHDQPWEGSSVGELRNFSGRGPRLDGARGVDIAAPDDPYAALSATPSYLEAGYGRSWFYTFGGTSGAGPHVAATVALLRGLNPDWSSEQVENALIASVRTGTFTDSEGALPNTGWGYGKLDTYAALHGQPLPQRNEPPVASAIEQAGPNLRVVANDPDGDELKSRWDFDYDGNWDTDWLDGTSVVAPATIDAAVRVDVADGRGGLRGIAARPVVVDAPGEDLGGSADAGGGGGEDAGDVRIDIVDLEPKCAGCSSGGRDASPLLPLLFGLIAWRRRRPGNGHR